MVKKEDIKREVALQTHLTYNFLHLNIPAVFPLAKEAIALARLGLWDTVLTLPGGAVLTVAQIVDDLRLQEFIDSAKPEQQYGT
jgi:hypothetical protein